MIAILKGAPLGPYYCSNCKMRQPELRCTCFFCGDHFSNFEDKIIEADLESFRLHYKECEFENESNICGED